MNINEHLLKKIKAFPGDYSYLADMLLKEIDKGKKSIPQMQQLLLDEIAEIIAEED